MNQISCCTKFKHLCLQFVLFEASPSTAMTSRTQILKWTAARKSRVLTRNSVCSWNSPQPCLDPPNQNGTMNKVG